MLCTVVPFLTRVAPAPSSFLCLRLWLRSSALCAHPTLPRGFRREFYEHEFVVILHIGWLSSVFENPCVMRGGTRRGLDNELVIGVVLFTTSLSSPVKSGQLAGSEGAERCSSPSWAETSLQHLKVHLNGCSWGLSWLCLFSLHLHVTARRATRPLSSHCHSRCRRCTAAPNVENDQPRTYLLHCVLRLRASQALHGL